jgi:SSS family solute:Na+ symporter
MLHPGVIIVPGLIARSPSPGSAADGDLQYNNAIPLMATTLPERRARDRDDGLLAAFMAGVAANVTSFNTVVTYDLIEPYVRAGTPDTGTCAWAAS